MLGRERIPPQMPQRESEFLFYGCTKVLWQVEESIERAGVNYVHTYVCM